MISGCFQLGSLRRGHKHSLRYQRWIAANSQQNWLPLMHCSWRWKHRIKPLARKNISPDSWTHLIFGCKGEAAHPEVQVWWATKSLSGSPNEALDQPTHVWTCNLAAWKTLKGRCDARYLRRAKRRLSPPVERLE